MAEIRGQLISGKYRLLAALGEGAMGVVYRAEQLDAEGQSLREVALKMVQPTFSRDPDFARRFLREVRIAARLRNPHTVTVYDTGQSEAGHLYYAMELVQGPTLKELLQRHGSLPVERVVRIVGQVCEALAEAHSLPEPVVHRDLKPANIFVETRQWQEWAKVGDFGIAKVVGEHTSGLTHTGASPGTPRYMAPEQWMGKEVDGRADLYALGIMLYEMLTGKAPFSGGEGPLALMYQHLHDPPPLLLHSLPAGVCLQVERLLVKAPQGRPTDALGVRRALEAALTGEDGRSTIVEEQQKVSLGETEVLAGVARPPVEVEQETVAPRTLMQPATVVQPRAVATRGRARGAALWRYGAAGSLIVLVVLIGGQWYHSRQPAEEGRQQSAVEQEAAATKAQPQREETQQTTQAEPKRKEEKERGQQEEVAQPPSQEQPPQQQAKLEPPESAEEVQRKAEERKKAELTQRVAELLARADKQKAAKRLTTPARDNAVETYRELLRMAPGHEEAVAGVKEIKEQYRQLADAAQQKREWAKAQGHYEAALKVDPQSGTLSAALQQVKEERKQAEAIAGWYQTTTSTPVLKEPRPNTAVITTLLPQKRVHVAGAAGDYVRIESVRGNPPGYIARKDVARVQGEPQSPGEVQQAALKEPAAGIGQQPTVKEMSQVEARVKLEQMGVPYSVEAATESVKKGDTRAVELFLAAGMNPNTKDAHGQTGLMLAAFGGHTDIVQMAIAKGANVNDATHKDGLTALMMAADAGQTATVQALIAGGANVEARSKSSSTALMVAARKDHTATVQALIANGADVNAKGHRGLTALMVAADFGHTATVQTLVANGADMNARDNDGWTALRFAEHRGRAEVAQLLKRAGASR